MILLSAGVLRSPWCGVEAMCRAAAMLLGAAAMLAAMEMGVAQELDAEAAAARLRQGCAARPYRRRSAHFTRAVAVQA